MMFVSELRELSARQPSLAVAAHLEWFACQIELLTARPFTRENMTNLVAVWTKAERLYRQLDSSTNVA